MNDIEFKKRIVESWFVSLQEQICEQFETIEKKFSKTKKIKKFTRRIWRKNNSNEGGGLSLLLNNGSVFDKVGINHSTVSGKFRKKFRSKILGAEKNGNYWASGVSVVAHMKNPKIPAIHFNTRYICTTQNWFGGGMDATPSYNDKKEENLIHKILEGICVINKKNYHKYKNGVINIFIYHIEEARGIGGIFFDYETKDWIKNFKFVRDLV